MGRYGKNGKGKWREEREGSYAPPKTEV